MKNLLRLFGLAFALACLHSVSFAQGTLVFQNDAAVTKAFKNQGAFSTTQNYAANDVVTQGGANYYAPTAIAASTTAPPVGAWLLFGGSTSATGTITVNSVSCTIGSSCTVPMPGAANSSTAGLVKLDPSQTSNQLSKVATTGAYGDLFGPPTLGPAAARGIAGAGTGPLCPAPSGSLTGNVAIFDANNCAADSGRQATPFGLTNQVPTSQNVGGVQQFVPTPLSQLGAPQTYDLEQIAKDIAVSSPLCTISGTTYTTPADCAYFRAMVVWNGGNHAGFTIQAHQNSYVMNYPWIFPTAAYNANSINVNCDNSTFIAGAAMAQMWTNTVSIASGSVKIRGGCTLDGGVSAGHHLAQGGANFNNLGHTLMDDLVVQNIDWQGGNGASNLPFSCLGCGDSHLNNFVIGGNTGHAGRLPDIKATLTSGAISAITIYQQLTGLALSANGTGGAAGTYPITFTAGTSSCRVYPSGQVKVTSAGAGYDPATLSIIYWGSLCTPGNLTATVGGGTAVTGATFTTTLTPGGSGFGTTADPEGVVLPVTPIWVGGDCTTPPAVYQNSNSVGANYSVTLVGQLVKPPTITYDGTGTPTGATSFDGSVAAVGAGCTTPMYLYLATLQPFYDGAKVSLTDGGATFWHTTAGINGIESVGSGVFEHMHPQNPYGMIVTGGGIQLSHFEGDSNLVYGLDIRNSVSTFTDGGFTYDASSNHLGSRFIRSGTNNSTANSVFDGVGCGNLMQDPTDFNTFTSFNGAIQTGTGTFTTGMVAKKVVHCNAEPNLAAEIAAESVSERAANGTTAAISTATGPLSTAIAANTTAAAAAQATANAAATPASVTAAANAAQAAAQAASDPLGTAAGLVYNNQTASTGGVTANTMVYPDPANLPKFTVAAVNTCGTGPASATAAANATFRVLDPIQTWSVLVDGAVAAGDILIGSATTPGYLHDSGQTASASISQTAFICGKALTAAASAGSLVTVDPVGRGLRGGKLDTLNGQSVSANAASQIVSAAALPQQSNVLADYQLNDGSGTAPIDSSGNGNTGSFPGSSTLYPTWTPQGLSCNGLVTTNTGDYFLTAGTQNAKSISITYSYIPPVPPVSPVGQYSYPNYPTLWGNQAHAGMSFSGLPGQIGNTMGMLTNGTNLGISQFSFIGTHTLTRVFGVTGSSQVNDATYLDGALVPQVTNTTSYGNSTDPFAVCGSGFNISASTYFSGNVYRWTAWSTQLSANDAATVHQKNVLFAQNKSVVFTPQPSTAITNALVVSSNSLGAGYQSSGGPATNYLSTNYPFTVLNDSLGGLQGNILQTMLPAREKYQVQPLGKYNVLLNWELTNDLVAGRTPQQAVDAALTMCREARSFGFKALVGTMIDRQLPTSQTTNKNSANTLLRAQWQTACDGLVDFAADPRVGADNASISTTYFYTDEVHLITNGQQNVIAPMESHALDALTGSTPAACDPTVVTASTYTSVAADGCKSFSVASNSITDTLSSAIGFTGRLIQRCNVTGAATANVLTIAAPSDYPFNNVSGSTTVTVPNNSCIQFKSTLVSASAGGDFWAISTLPATVTVNATACALGSSCTVPAPVPSHAVTPLSYLLLPGGSGSTWPYTVGTGVLTATSGAWVTDGRYYNASYDTVPCSNYNGARTLMVAYKTDIGAAIVNASSLVQTPIIGFDSGTPWFDVGASHSQQGPAYLATGSTTAGRSLDRAAGPTIGTVVIPASGSVAVSVNGNPPNALYTAQTSQPAIACTSSTTYVGTIAGYGTGYTGTLMAIEAWSTALTAAQYLAEEQKMAYDLNVLDPSLTFSDKTDYGRGAVVAGGDSVNEVGGANKFTYIGSIEKAMVAFGTDLPYMNVAHSGYQSATTLSEFPQTTTPLLRQFNQGPRIFFDNVGTNDNNNSVAAATTIANIASIAALATANGAITIEQTILPAARNTGPENTIRLATNAGITSAALAGTYLLSDWANDLTMGNINNDANATLYVDSIVHPSALGYTYLANEDALALHRALEPSRPFWFKAPLSSLVFTGNAALTQTNTLVQLLPGETVCGMKSQVTTAFSGTSVTAFTLSVGDSNGTATQYQPGSTGTLNLLATGSTITLSPNFVSANGIVQAHWTATGANTSAISAGAGSIEVCLVTIP